MEYFAEKEGKRMKDLEVGDKFTSISGTVTEGMIDSFVRQLGIDHPLFLNDEYAKKLGFKSRVSTALLTFSYMMGLLYKSGLLRDGVYLGSDKITHKFPVYPGDIIRGEIEVLEKNPKGDRIVFRYHWQVRNQNDEIVSTGINT